MANFGVILKKLFGTKSDRDLKAIMPYVDQINEIYARFDQLSNDELRAETDRLKNTIREYIAELSDEKKELRNQLRNTDIEISEKERIATEIDKLTKKIDEQIEEILLEILPEAFAIMKSTARRFKENATVEVTATDFDRDIASRKDSVTINGNKAIWQNKWMAGGNMITWDMVHYDVQLFGGVVLHVSGNAARFPERLSRTRRSRCNGKRLPVKARL